MKKTRNRDVNIAIQTVFRGFERAFNMSLEYAKKDNNKSHIELRLDEIERAGDTIRDELFGMRLVGAFTWREYVVLREKTRRIEADYKNTIKSL